MRTHLALGASVFLLLACGDDSGGSGGSGTTATTTSPSSSPSSTSTTSGDGGGTTSAVGTGGEGGGTGGPGGAGGTGSTGTGGPSDTVQEACEQLNATYDALAEVLGCPVTPGNCDVPADPCDPELIAFLDCLRGTTADDCACAEDPENPRMDLLTCTIGDCQAENDAYVECAL